MYLLTISKEITRCHREVFSFENAGSKPVSVQVLVVRSRSQNESRLELDHHQRLLNPKFSQLLRSIVKNPRL